MPDYELTIAGRIGPVIASCLPGFRSVAPPATVLHLLVSNPAAVVEMLEVLAAHDLTPVDVRIIPHPSQPDGKLLRHNRNRSYQPMTAAESAK